MFFEGWSDADVIVTARAHAAVLAGMRGIPSLCISLEPKLRIVSANLGQGSASVDAAFDPVQALETLIDLLEARDRLAKELRAQAL